MNPCSNLVSNSVESTENTVTFALLRFDSLVQDVSWTCGRGKTESHWNSSHCCGRKVVEKKIEKWEQALYLCSPGSRRMSQKVGFRQVQIWRISCLGLCSPSAVQVEVVGRTRKVQRLATLFPWKWSRKDSRAV